MNHHKLSPSSYPAWSRCPHWEAYEKEQNREADEGTAQHELLSQALDGRVDLSTVDAYKETLFPVRRAYKAIREFLSKTFNYEEYTLETEVLCMDDELPQSPYGTADIVAWKDDELVVIDYKSFATNKTYWEQVAFYANAQAKAYEKIGRPIRKITLAIFYGELGNMEIKETNREECEAMATYAIGCRLNKNNLPRKPTAWCSLCKHCGQCSPSVEIIHEAQVILPRDEVVGTIDPVRLAGMLSVISEVEHRAKRVKEYAKKVAIDNGDMLCDHDGNPLYKVYHIAKRKLDIKKLFNQIRTMVSADELLANCSTTQEKIKKLLKGREYLGEKITTYKIEELIDAASERLPEEPQLRRVK